MLWNTASYFESASSGQLLRVRERQGDLCSWPSPALKSAQALVHAIEEFMDTFFLVETISRKLGSRLNDLEWVVAATGPLCIDGRRRRDCFNIAIKRSAETGKWHADIGKIEAVLSLWMATIEAKRTEEERISSELKTAADVSSIRASSNWRCTKAGVDLRHDFCRILGDDFEDGILKRDLAWWVDDLIADQSDALSPDKGESQKPVQQGDSKLAARKKDKRPAEIVINKPSWQPSVA